MKATATSVTRILAKGKRIVAEMDKMQALYRASRGETITPPERKAARQFLRNMLRDEEAA
jgi:hypothetical protein